MPILPILRKGLLLALLLTLAGCAGSRLRSSLEDARPLLESVRPGVDLTGVRANVWTRDSQVPHEFTPSSEPLSFPFVRQVLRRHASLFEKLRLSTPGSLPLEPLIGPKTRIPAFVIPDEHRMLVRPQLAGRVGTMVHELAHIANWRKGYWEKPKAYFWLHPTERGAEFVDIDALVSAWALEEGSAELSEEVALARGEPAELEQVAQRFAVASGTLSPNILAPVYPRISFFAYGDGGRALWRHFSETQDVERSIARAWDHYRGTSREILVASEEPRPSALATRLRKEWGQLSPPPRAATRVGTFFTFQAISQQNDLEVEPAWGITRALVDDLWLEFEGGTLWISTWSSEEARAEFAHAIRTIAPEAEQESRGAHLLVAWGSVPETGMETLLPQP